SPRSCSTASARRPRAASAPHSGWTHYRAGDRTKCAPGGLGSRTRPSMPMLRGPTRSTPPKGSDLLVNRRLLPLLLIALGLIVAAPATASAAKIKVAVGI